MSSSVRAWTTVLVLTLLVVAGCTSGDGSDASATATASAEPTARPSAVASTTPPPSTATLTPSPTATVESTPQPGPSRMTWLVDAGSGELFDLDEAGSAWAARFDDAGTRVELNTADGPAAFALDGSPVPPLERLQCVQDGEAAIVGGAALEATRCGPISPNDRWMLFAVPIPDANGDWDQWVLDLQSGERRLLAAGLRHCGGCDGRFGPGFSSAETHAYFAELIQNGRTYVSDLRTGGTEVISDASTEIGARPVWAPTGARLLYSDDGRRVIVRDFDAVGAVEIASLDWPATFDSTGTAIYSPAYVGTVDAVSTTVVDATTLEGLAGVDGAPGVSVFWYPRVVVTRSPDGPVLVVEQAASCREGTMVYTSASPDGRCLDSAVGATVSPDGRRVAFAVLVNDTVSKRFPSDYRVVIVDTETLEPLATIEGAQSFEAPPALEWNVTGTHLLITGPWAFGL